MSKHQRIARFVQELAAGADPAHDPRYLAYFTCFNTQRYYEAHDVLEHLWLEQTGGERDFCKGLIQLAGAFVHLQKQHEHPAHPKHGRRLRPAARLFLRAAEHLEIYPTPHWGLEVTALCALARRYAAELEQGGFSANPWSPEQAPQLEFPKS
jgi:predicted metal-dependent hydrolase